MVNFDFRVEWEDGHLYITEEDGSCCSWRCKSPAEAGKYITEYIECIIEEVDQKAAESLLKTFELHTENKEY